MNTIKITIIIGILLTISFVFFTYARNQVLEKCNGEKIGKEIGGQNRSIYKCENGQLRII